MPKQVIDVLEDQWRDDSKDAAWHLGAVAEMWKTIEAAGVADQVRDLEVSVGPPAKPAEIAALQALVPEQLPPELVEAWRAVGSSTVTTPGHRYRFLSPKEIVARRGELRSLARKALVKRNPDIDVLALADDKPSILYVADQVPDADGEVWFHKGNGEHYQVLGHLINQFINLELMRTLQARIGDLYRLDVGRRPGANTRRARLFTDTRYFEAIVEGTQLLTRSAKIGTSKRPPSIKTFPTPEAAAKQFTKAFDAARAKGFAPLKKEPPVPSLYRF